MDGRAPLAASSRDRFGHGIMKVTRACRIGRDDRVANAESVSTCEKLAPFVRLRLRPAGRFTKHV